MLGVCRCAFCEYSEPCQWSLRKHFRLRHAGVALNVREYRDPDRDAQVERMVKDCMIHLQRAHGQHQPAEADSSTWKAPGALAQRGMRKQAGALGPGAPQNSADLQLAGRPTPPTGHDTLLR